VEGLGMESGKLVVSTAFGDLMQTRPYIYQQAGDEEVEVDGGFKLVEADMYGFQVAAYDTTCPLIIDPGLAYSTYLGGEDNDTGLGIAVDSSGCAYITGKTTSSDFPAKDGYSAVLQGQDAFVSKIDTSKSGDSSLVYSTYLGGGGTDIGSGIAVATIVKTTYAYVAGQTGSTDFPTTSLSRYQGDQGGTDAFITKLNGSGNSLMYSTYFGGDGNDLANGIDASGQYAYVTGVTLSAGFPCKNQYQTDQGTTDAFVCLINTGGSGEPSLIYSTYLGGSGTDFGYGIAVESGKAYVTGRTLSTDFPLLSPNQPDQGCLLYTSPSPRDATLSRMPSSA